MTHLCENWQKAIDLLQSGGYTCVLCREDTVYTTTERGVKPLVRWLTEKAAVQGFYAADKVVGKGAAALMIAGGVKTVYADVISEPAVELFDQYSINVEYDKKVINIINRQGDGICPVEQRCTKCDTIEECLQEIDDFVKSIM